MRLKQLLGDEWYDKLKDEFSQDYMKSLSAFVAKCREEGIVYPSPDNVFNAYRSTPYSKVRVCIIGQDPYINKGEAHGLSFSLENGRSTPSMRQIQKTVEKEIYNGLDLNWDNNLTRWTEQGVMLLNAVLTVNAGSSNSHRGKGWERFTARTVEELDKRGDVIFLLWGKDAQASKLHIKNSIVIEAEHPVAASYKGRDWDNNQCFTKVNDLLEPKIKW